MNNLYQLHNNPESLYKYSESYKVPAVAYNIVIKDPSKGPELSKYIDKDNRYGDKYLLHRLLGKET